jgi:hypothetical protein
MTAPPVSLEGCTVRMARTGTMVSVAPRLGEGGQGVVLAEGGVITAHHLRRDRDYDTVVATVEAHPARPGQVIPRNTGTQSWVMRPDGRERRRWSRAGGWRPAR